MKVIIHVCAVIQSVLLVNDNDLVAVGNTQPCHSSHVLIKLGCRQCHGRIVGAIDDTRQNNRYGFIIGIDIVEYIADLLNILVSVGNVVRSDMKQYNIRGI